VKSIKKTNKFVLWLTLGLFAVAGSLLLYFLISHGKAQKESEEYIDIQKAYTAVLEAVSPDSETPIVLQEAAPSLQLPYIAADFAGLRELNEDTIGWIAIPDTPISYPVMQTEDNQTYLKRDSSGKKSSAGAVFMDAGNSLSPLDQNTILYAHNMGEGREDEMFAPLLLYKEKEHYMAHPYIQFDTHIEAHGWWEVFAVLHLDIRDKGFNYLRQSFPNPQAFAEWLGKAQELSLYDTGVAVCETDSVLTLSTCDRSLYRGNGRFVLLAVHRSQLYKYGGKHGT